MRSSEVMVMDRKKIQLEGYVYFVRGSGATYPILTNEEIDNKRVGEAVELKLEELAQEMSIGLKEAIKERVVEVFLERDEIDAFIEDAVAKLASVVDLMAVFRQVAGKKVRVTVEVIEEEGVQCSRAT